ncbi:hypothetical protein [Nonomuraea montanisoli]|uniref:hypothetical protein n=1 Tax=Nonomuraea montanisoli TaxID=2741721 RepID=UPI001F42A64C|nr:hypothetical protein [Nonomuraea montanisoli]
MGEAKDPKLPSGSKPGQAARDGLVGHPEDLGDLPKGGPSVDLKGMRELGVFGRQFGIFATTNVEKVITHLSMSNLRKSRPLTYSIALRCPMFGWRDPSATMRSVSVPDSTLDPNGEPGMRKWWPLTAVCLGAFILLMDVTIVNVALPNMADDFDASFTSLQWVIDGYALALAALPPVGHDLGHRHPWRGLHQPDGRRTRRTRHGARRRQERRGLCRGTGSATDERGTPPAHRDAVQHLMHKAFVTGLDRVFPQLSAIAAAFGGLVVLTLVRPPRRTVPQAPEAARRRLFSQPDSPSSAV